MIADAEKECLMMIYRQAVCQLQLKTMGFPERLAVFKKQHYYLCWFARNGVTDILCQKQLLYSDSTDYH